METQNKIGWDNFIKDWICIKWKFAQHMFKETMSSFGGYDKMVWSSKVINALWNVFCLIWNVKNAHLHTEMETARSSTTDLQVCKAFSLEHSMSTSNQLLFYMPLHEHLQTSKGSKTMWLRSVHIAVNDLTIVHKCAPSQRTTTNFFQPQAIEINSSPTNIQVTIPENNNTYFMTELI
eukprot:1232818-Ditylum_brightwellii.AAC.1